MRALSARAWFLAVLSAFLQMICFPIAAQAPRWRTAFCWVALVPLLDALLAEDSTGKKLSLGAGTALGYLCGIAWYMGSCGWIYQTMNLYGGLEKPVAFAILVLFSLYLGLYHALFALLLTALKRSAVGARGALLLSPFVWVAVELARARITGFPWDLLGNAQVDNLLLTRLAPFGGVMAISFVVVAVNAAISAFRVVKERNRWAIPFGGLAVALILQVGARFGVRPTFTADQVAVMVQENLAVGATAKGERPLNLEDELQQFTTLSLHPIGQGLGKLQEIGAGRSGLKPTIVIWPEAPSHLQSNNPLVVSQIASLARSSDAPVVVGMLGVDSDRSVQRGYYLYDSAAFFDRTGAYRGRYDKIHLVPWGEYVPFKDFVSFAKKLTEGVGDMDRGHARTIFRTDGHAYGVFVCYESVFGDEVREFARNGAEVLVNISDDGWYGDSGAPWQHLNMARMRAIENHRWVLRSTNTGETTTIDPGGNYITTARHVRVAYALPFGFEHDETFYTRHGDWFAYGCAGVTMLALGFSLTRRMN